MKQIPEELFDQLLEGYEKTEDPLGREGLLANLQKAVIERALEAELGAHLGYVRHDPAGRGSWQCRGTATPASSPSWSSSARVGSRASTSK